MPFQLNLVFVLVLMVVVLRHSKPTNNNNDIITGLPTGFEVLAERSVRIAEENERLKNQNLQYSNQILAMNETITRLREDRVTHLLREQDFYDLEQKILLSKEMGCAYKKANRMCKKNKYWCRVVATAIDFDETTITGFNDAIRQRKIHRKKLNRSIAIVEFPDEEWVPPPPKSAIQLSSEGDDEAQPVEGEATQRRPTTKPKRKKRKAAAGNTSPSKRVTGRQAMAGSIANFSQASTSAATGTETSFTAPNPEERDPNPGAAVDEDLTSPIANLPAGTIVVESATESGFPDMPAAFLENSATDPNWEMQLDSQDSISTSSSVDLLTGRSKKRKTVRAPLDGYVPLTRSASKNGKLNVLCHNICCMFLCRLNNNYQCIFS